MAKKNDITLMEKGKCKFCAAETTRGIHERVEIFNLGFQLINPALGENLIYRFLSVDTNTLQHSEIHER